MRWLSGVFITPIGIALLAMHWLVVIFAYIGDAPEPGFGVGTHLLFYLALVDVLPLLIANGLVNALSHLFSIQIATYISFGVLIALASLQWLLIGSFVQLFVRNYFAEEESDFVPKTLDG